MTLLEVCEFIIDTEHKTAPFIERGIPSIRTPNVGKGRLILDKDIKYVDDHTFTEWTKRAVPQKEDIIIAREAPVGNVAIVPDVQLCLGQRTVLARPDRTKVDPYYLCYYLLSPKMQHKMLSGSGGSTVAHLNMKDIRSLTLPDLPPLLTQQRIASILSAYDDLIENNLKRIRILEEKAFLNYKQLISTEALERHRLKDILDLKYGKALKADDRKEGKFPVIGSSGNVGTHDEFYVDGPGIIVGRKGNIGSVFWSDENFWPIDTVYYVDSDLSYYFLYFNLKEQHFVNTDAAVPGLNRNFALDNWIDLPLEKAIHVFDNVVKPIFQLMNILRKQNAKLLEARDILLPRFMSGEIEV